MLNMMLAYHDQWDKVSVTMTGNMEMEPDIENMMMSEYLEYEAVKVRRLWDDVRSRRSPTHYYEADFSPSYRNKNKKDSDFNKILEDLFRIGADNLKRMGQDIVQDSICKQDVGLEEDQEEDGDDRDTFDMWDIMIKDVERIRQFITPNVPEVIKDVIQPLIPKTLHTTPPNEDYVAPATKSILDELLEEFGDEILNITMVDEGADFKPNKYVLWKPSRDFTRLLRPPSGLKGLLHTLNATMIPTKLLQVDAHGVVLG
ncbi:hypothetical protein Tco_1173282 [Tanacetum coccineum]